jgi:hypothetical protein
VKVRALLLFCLICPALSAQTPVPRDDSSARIARLESEIAALRDRVEPLERRALDEDLRRESTVHLYGDIGLRFHQQFEGNTETFNRPEFRLHLGVFGTAFNQADQRIRYDLRLTTFALDPNDKPAPTLAWLPFPGYGATGLLGVDRFLVEYWLANQLGVTMGRFPTPYAGTELLFDHDYNFQGLSESVRFDRIFGPRFRRYTPRLELVAVQAYLAENNIGLPTPSGSDRPVYLGAQLRLELAPFEKIEYAEGGNILSRINSEFEFRLAFGVHWFDGANAIAQNLGVGYLLTTTNILDEEGNVRSRFLIGEGIGEVLLFRSKEARVRAQFHGLWNFQAEEDARGRTNHRAFKAGLSWGMERFTERWHFLAAARYFYLEPDAAVPEFNSEALNTNIKGYEFELMVRAFPTVTVFGTFTFSERKDYELPGFGRPSSTDPTRSPGQTLRVRFGMFLEF